MMKSAKGSGRSTVATAVVLLAGGLRACDRDEEIMDPPPAELSESFTAVLVTEILVEVADADCRAQQDVDPATPLFHIPHTEAVAGACEPLLPLIAPDGERLTAGEYVAASGEATVTCVEGGTRYDFSFEGLIPDGVYTIWHFPGTGGGALASHPGDIQNVFTASPSGTSEFSVTGTAGPMTLFGAAEDCTLPVPATAGDEFGLLFVLVYHKNNRDWGDFPGPEDTQTGHLAFPAR